MLTEQALLDDMHRRSADENERNRLSTVFLVEATDYEQQHLWLDWSEDALEFFGEGKRPNRRVAWEQITLGYGTKVGTFGGMPVFVAVSFARVRGLVVAFYEATSQVVDHRMVEKWRGPAFPASRGHTNATNFHSCVHALDAMCERMDSAKAAK